MRQLHRTAIAIVAQRYEYSATAPIPVWGISQRYGMQRRHPNFVSVGHERENNVNIPVTFVVLLLYYIGLLNDATIVYGEMKLPYQCWMLST